MKKLSLLTAAFIFVLGAFNKTKAQNIYTFAGIAANVGYSGDGGHAAIAQISGPRGVAVDAAGNVYFADSRNNVIRKVTTGGIISTVAGIAGPGGYGGDGGSATAGQLNGPVGVAVDGSGNIYVADAGNSVIRKVSAAGIITTIAGNNTAGYMGDGGPAIAAELNRAGFVAVNRAGLVYISDSRNDVIRMVDLSGNISTIAGNGTPGYTGDGGPATAATMGRTQGIAVDTAGNVYIADPVNFVVRKINTSGTISTFAGNNTTGYGGDGGAATAAMLTFPDAIGTDAAGNVYITDATNNRVRKVNAAGIISSITGNGIAAYSGDGGLATLAQVSAPAGVAVDASSNIYIADNGNDVIRRIGTPVTSISITTPTGDTICAGAAIHFTATAYADTTPHYQWQVNGVNAGTDSAGFTDATLVAGDMVDCILMDTVGGTSLAVSVTLRVNARPFAGTITGPATICIGGNAIYRDTAIGRGVWSITDTIIATLRRPSGIIAHAAGTETIYYIMSNICGSDTATDVVSIVANTTGPITGPKNICEGTTVTYTDATTGGTWVARGPGGPGGLGTIDATGDFTAGTNPGMIVIAYGTSPSCAVLDTITINPLPVVSGISGPTVVDSGATITESDGLAGGTWSCSNTSIASIDALTGVVTGISAGTVTITYTVTGIGGCSADTTINVTVIVNPAGVADVQNNAAFSIFPNPATSGLVITWKGGAAAAGNVVIADVTGREVYKNEVTFNSSTNQARLDVSSLKPGIYMISVNSGNSYYYGKIVIE